MNPGIEKALKKLNIDYDIFYYQQTDWEEDAHFEEILDEQMKNNCYEKVFSVNFAPVVSKVCSRYGVPYVSWVYDSPMHIRNLEVMKNSCNHIYLFDYGQVQKYRKMGIPMEHMPLAAEPTDFKLPFSGSNGALNNKNIKPTSKHFQVSMVGKMYTTDYNVYTSPLITEVKSALDNILNAQRDLYGRDLIGEALTEELINEINREYASQNFDIKINLRELSYMMYCEVTNKERQIVLSLLAKHFDSALFTTETKVEIPNLNVYGHVDYYTQMPQIFRNTDVNLNISLKAIQTGIPLRVLDVMACGGFLLSNYQAEIEEYFKIGEECETYGSFMEAYEKTKFYLEHDEARRHIARNGYEKIKRDFTFEDRLGKMLISGDRK